MIRATCNVCHYPILVDPDTGNKFDAADIGHRHKSKPATSFNPGQYSNEQIVAAQQAAQSTEPSGYCETCKRPFTTFHDAFLHMLSIEGHAVHSVAPRKK